MQPEIVPRWPNALGSVYSSSSSTPRERNRRSHALAFAHEDLCAGQPTRYQGSCQADIYHLLLPRPRFYRRAKPISSNSGYSGEDLPFEPQIPSNPPLWVAGGAIRPLRRAAPSVAWPESSRLPFLLPDASDARMLTHSLVALRSVCKLGPSVTPISCFYALAARGSTSPA